MGEGWLRQNPPYPKDKITTFEELISTGVQGEKKNERHEEKREVR